MNRAPRTYAEFEYCAEIALAFTPGRGAYDAIRVTWRRRGSRAWSSFLLALEDGVSFRAACAKINPAIDAHAHAGGSLEVTR